MEPWSRSCCCCAKGDAWAMAGDDDDDDEDDDDASSMAQCVSARCTAPVSGIRVREWQRYAADLLHNGVGQQKGREPVMPNQSTHLGKSNYY